MPYELLIPKIQELCQMHKSVKLKYITETLNAEKTSFKKYDKYLFEIEEIKYKYFDDHTHSIESLYKTSEDTENDIRIWAKFN